MVGFNSPQPQRYENPTLLKIANTRHSPGCYWLTALEERAHRTVEMTPEQRERMLDLNEQLCREYNATDDDAVLAKIAATEYALFWDPDHVPASDEDN